MTKTKLLKTIVFTVIVYLIVPVLFVGNSTGQKGEIRDIIHPLVNAQAGDDEYAINCKDSGNANSLACKILGNDSQIKFFNFKIFNSIEPTQDGTIVVLMNVLKYLFYASTVYALVIVSKTVIQGIKPWGDNAEETKTAKKKFVEIGKAFIIPAIIMVIMIVMSMITGYWSPFDFL